MSNYKEKLLKVNTFVFDYDGVLSDGYVLINSNGDALRTANVKDGYAMQLAVKKGYRLAIISGGHSKGVPVRLQRLGIEDVHMGVTDKSAVFHELLQKRGIQAEDVLYMGDDLPDLPLLKLCGVPCCPADAVHEIKDHSIYVSPFEGGNGCVRDVIEQTMRLHGTWE